MLRMEVRAETKKKKLFQTQTRHKSQPQEKLKTTENIKSGNDSKIRVSLSTKLLF